MMGARVRVAVVGLLGVIVSAIGFALLLQYRAFGWTAYAPLSTLTFTPWPGLLWLDITLAVLGAVAAGASGALLITGARRRVSRR